MGVPTGYSDAERKALRDALAQGRARLRAAVPAEPMGGPLLVCSCDRCFDTTALKVLQRVPARDLTPEQIGQYFGGAGAVDIPTDDDARREAQIVFLHVMDALAEAVLADRRTERAYKREHSFVEPNYWQLGILRTGFINAMEARLREDVIGLLQVMLEICLAKGSARLEDCVDYLGCFDGALERMLERLQSGPPRRHLAFWAGLGGGAANSPAGMRGNGVSDFPRTFNLMPDTALAALIAALDAPATGRMMERFGYAAKDAEWLGFLSRLIAWRENTMLRHSHGDRTRTYDR